MVASVVGIRVIKKLCAYSSGSDNGERGLLHRRRQPRVCGGRSDDQSEDAWFRIAGSGPDGSDLDRRSRRSNAGWSGRTDVRFAWKPSWECYDSLVWSRGGLGDSLEKTAEPSTARHPTSNSTNLRRRDTGSKCNPA